MRTRRRLRNCEFFDVECMFCLASGECMSNDLEGDCPYYEEEDYEEEEE